jgi:hypothetical protein
VINPCHLHDPNGMSQPDDITKTLSKHGVHFATEGAGVVYALRSRRHSVQEEDLTVVTDHEALRLLVVACALRGRFPVWVWTIQDIPFAIVHRPGVYMVVPDILVAP